MRKIGFVGVWDKTNLMLNIAKLLQSLGYKILIIDSTSVQKARYVVPSIMPTVSYITDFHAIDVAAGFKSLKDIAEYSGIEEKKLDYDVALIDFDNEEGMNNFNIYEMQINYYVTSFDLYTLKRSLEIFDNFKNPIVLNKVLFSGEMSNEENEYLNYLSLGKKIIWEKQIIYFPVNTNDYLEISDNERKGMIKFKNLSSLYRESVEFMADQILEHTKTRELKLSMKQLILKN